MRRKYDLANTRLLPTEDQLGNWLAAFAFEPHAFGHQKDDPAAVCPMRVIGDFEMICNLGGESQIIFHQDRLLLHAGELVLIPPFTPHAIWTPPDQLHETYWMHFDVGPAWLQPRFLTAVLPVCGRRIALRQPSAWLAVFAALEQEQRAGQPGFRMFLRAALLQAVTYLMREPDVVAAGVLAAPAAALDKKRQVQRELVRRCTEMILADLAAPHPAETMAGALHVSQSVLQKAFAAEMGMPPHQFILMARLRRAESLLLTTEMTLDEIAVAAGLSTGHYLNNVFKRFYRMSPRAWLQTNRI